MLSSQLGVLLLTSTVLHVYAKYSVNVGGQIKCGDKNMNKTANVYLFEIDGTFIDPDDHCASTTTFDDAKFKIAGFDSETFDPQSDGFYLIINGTCANQALCRKFPLREDLYENEIEQATYTYIRSFDFNKLETVTCPSLKEKKATDEC